MTNDKIPTTTAVLALRREGVEFVPRLYRYEEHGGTAVAARELGVEEHQVIKTLVMEDDVGKPFIILMHGDKEVSTKNLARILNVKSVKPCDPRTVERHTGYRVGGTSPFGTRKPLPVYMEETIAGLPRIYINAGGRGILAEMSPADLIRVLKPGLVQAAI